MKRIPLILAFAILASCRDARPPTGPIGPVGTRGDDRSPAEMESYIVQLKRDARPASAFATAHGVSPKFVYLHALNGFAAALGAAAASGLAHDPDVVLVTPVHEMHVVQEANLRDMRPVFSRNDKMDGRFADSEGGCQTTETFAACLPRTDRRNLNVCQLGQWIGLSLAVGPSSAILGEHVGEVVRLSSGEQMRRIATRRVVAPVQDAEPFWYRSIGGLPRYSVCQGTPAAVVDESIAGSIDSSGPIPTLIATETLHATPQPNLDWNSWARGPTGYRTTRIADGRHTRRTNIEGSSAARTGDVWHDNNIIEIVANRTTGKPAPANDPCQTNPPTNLDRIDQARNHLDGRYCYWASAGAGVHVYLIDSGIRTSHIDFAGRIGAGADFVGDGNGVEDCLGHGTHVSGILGGTTYGVAKLVTIHPVRVFGCSGTTTDATVLAAIDWVIANGIRPAVVNMSLEGSHSDVDDAAVESMVAAGFVVTVAAGNDVGDACNFSPASAPDAITVGGTQGNLGKYGLTNTGPCVDLFAPAEASSDWFTSDNATFFQTGTSMSAPGVGGAAALYLGEHATASPAAVASYLLLTATAGAITGLTAGTANLFLRTHNGTP